MLFRKLKRAWVFTNNSCELPASLAIDFSNLPCMEHSFPDLGGHLCFHAESLPRNNSYTVWIVLAFCVGEGSACGEAQSIDKLMPIWGLEEGFPARVWPLRKGGAVIISNAYNSGICYFKNSRHPGPVLWHNRLNFCRSTSLSPGCCTSEPCRKSCIPHSLMWLHLQRCLVFSFSS